MIAKLVLRDDTNISTICLFFMSRTEKTNAFQHMNVICTYVSLHRCRQSDSIGNLMSLSVKRSFFYVYVMRSNLLCNEVCGLF
jgi:hypothetical protein